MGWNHPDIPLEEMLKLVKGFIDILILASGYQSSGLLAHLDSHNIKRAFEWALFFENVFRRLSNLDVDAYHESIKELDAALFEIISHPSFPQGLAHLSSATLRRARCFLLEYLLSNLPLRDSHLRAFLTAIVEMDLVDLSETERGYLNSYLNKLTLQDGSCKADSMASSLDLSPKVVAEKANVDDYTKLAVWEIHRRQSLVSCVSTLEEVLDMLSNAVRDTRWTESERSLFREQMKHEYFPPLERNAESSVDAATWNSWKSSALSYFLDKRTIRLVSGASLIFSSTNTRWGNVFGQLNFKSTKSDLQEAIEILLLGCITSRWNSVIEHLLSVSYDSLTIPKQYNMLTSAVTEIGQSFHKKEETIKSKEGGILDYLMELLDGQLHLLWKSSPALIAVSLPSWSPLFRLYLSEIEAQFKGNPPTVRFCDCMQDKDEHKDCELAERIWCLYIFHVYSSQRIDGAHGE